MFKINKKAFPRLSKSEGGRIVVVAFKEYIKEMGENAVVGIFYHNNGFALVCLDRMDGIIEGTKRDYNYSDFELIFDRRWIWQIKEQKRERKIG